MGTSDDGSILDRLANMQCGNGCNYHCGLYQPHGKGS
jgi:hypothetical protein